MAKAQRSWSRLDHAAKLYTAIADSTNSATFRLSAYLNEPVDLDRLQEATDRTMVRFRTFRVRLAKGFFWSYLRDNHTRVIAEIESDYPNAPIDSHTAGGHLIRVLCFGNRISVEFFHAVTDGSGGLEFLKSLLHSYLSGEGEHDLPTEGKVIAADTLPERGEDSDSFSDYRDHCRDVAGKYSHEVIPARHLEGTPFEKLGHNVVEAIVPTEDLKKAALASGVSITAYLGAVALAALRDPQVAPPSDLPFVLAIPVNLRRLLPSRTFRNFFVVARIGEEFPPEMTFENLAHSVFQSLRQALTPKQIAISVSETMRFDSSLPSRFTPNLVKRSAIRFGYHHFGESNVSMTLSNLGAVDLPAEMSQHIERFDFHLYPTQSSPVALAVISYGGLTTISFSRSIVEADFVRKYVDLLHDHGCDVEATSNQWGM